MYRLFLTLTAAVTLLPLAGCEPKKEKVLEIETPEGSLEIERTKDSGPTTIEIKDKKN